MKNAFHTGILFPQVMKIVVKSGKKPYNLDSYCYVSEKITVSFCNHGKFAFNFGCSEHTTV